MTLYVDKDGTCYKPLSNKTPKAEPKKEKTHIAWDKVLIAFIVLGFFALIKSFTTPKTTYQLNASESPALQMITKAKYGVEK